MTIAAARHLRDCDVCFVGIGKPSAAANLARLTQAPRIVLIYESGTIGAKPGLLPLSIGDGELAQTADSVVSVPEIFRYWLQSGRIDVGFLGAAQIDRFGNINTTIIGGTYEKPQVRLPGAGGAPEIAIAAKRVCIILKQSRRTFVEKVDFVTSCGCFGDHRSEHASTTVITDLGIFISDSTTRELVLSSLHPGVTEKRAREATGWDLKVSRDLNETSPPCSEELVVLRDLYARTALAYGTSAGSTSAE